jgi:hypothetical protein
MPWPGNIINQIKAYVAGTDSLRTEEINPLSQQYVSELLVSTTNLAIAVYYYPSAAGAAMAGYKDVSFDYFLVGGVGTTLTMTIEGTSDDVTPYWHDITQAGYNLGTNAAGSASFVAGPGVTTQGILDFDEYNAKLIRVKLDVAGGALNTERIRMRRKAL